MVDAVSSTRRSWSDERGHSETVKQEWMQEHGEKEISRVRHDLIHCHSMPFASQEEVGTFPIRIFESILWQITQSISTDLGLYNTMTDS